MLRRSGSCFIVLTAALCASSALSNQNSSEAEIAALIALLPSPNPPPVDDGKPRRTPPPGYDFAKQKIVTDAYQRLDELGPAAWPQLFACYGDERYCLTQRGGSSDRDFTVGEAAQQLVRDQIMPYGLYVNAGEADPRRLPRRPDYVRDQGLDDRAKAEAWWKAREGKSLVELQADALNWIIAEEAKYPEAYSELERQHLKDQLAELKNTGQPLLCWMRFLREVKK